MEKFISFHIECALSNSKDLTNLFTLRLPDGRIVDHCSDSSQVPAMIERLARKVFPNSPAGEPSKS